MPQDWSNQKSPEYLHYRAAIPTVGLSCHSHSYVDRTGWVFMMRWMSLHVATPGTKSFSLWLSGPEVGQLSVSVTPAFELLPLEHTVGSGPQQARERTHQDPSMFVPSSWTSFGKTHFCCGSLSRPVQLHSDFRKLQSSSKRLYINLPSP